MPDTKLTLKVLAARVEELAADVKTLLATKELPVPAPAASASEVLAEPQRDFFWSPNPVPTDYRDIVDSMLNRHFGVRIETHSDSPAFTFTIVVPDTYSSLTPSERELKHEDLRPKVLTFADGTAGVREWAERVFNNFNPELKARIVADRVTL